MCDVLTARENISEKRGRAQGLREGIRQGVYALVNAFKGQKNGTEIHRIITSNPGFEDVTLEQVEEILHELS